MTFIYTGADALELLAGADVRRPGQTGARPAARGGPAQISFTGSRPEAARKALDDLTTLAKTYLAISGHIDKVLDLVHDWNERQLLKSLEALSCLHCGHVQVRSGAGAAAHPT